MSNKCVRLWQRALIMMVVAALLINTLPVYAQSGNVTMSKEKWGTTVWVADWKQRHQGDDRIRDTLATLWLTQLYKDNPNMNRNDGVSKMNDFLLKYQRETVEGQSPWEFVTRTVAEEGLKGAKAFSGFADEDSKVPAIIDVLDWVNGLVWKYKDSVNHEAAYHKGYEALQKVNGHEEEVQGAAIEEAKSNPEMAYVYNAIFRPPVNIEKATTDPEDVLELNPLVVPEVIKERIIYKSDGSVLIALSDLKAEVANQTNLINEVIDGQKEVAEQINHLQENFQAYVQDQQAQANAKKVQEAEAQVDQLKLKAAQSGVYIVSTLIGVADPKLGHQVGVVGNAGIEIAQSLMNYTDTMVQLGKLVEKGLDGKILGLASNLGAVILTGNILAAVMDVVSLFQESGPTDEQLILQQVGEMRQQLEDVRQEMHERFDRVDQQLNTIYGDMMNQFAQINLSQWQTRNDINDIQTKLMDMDMNLHAIESQMNEWAQDEANSRLYERINYVVGYKDRFPVPIDGPTYYDYQNTFFHWATQEASNSINAGGYNLPIEEYTETERELAQLNRPLDQRLNYLDGWLAAHGLQPFSNNRLANPQVWALSTRAYAQMKYDWPQYALVHDPNKLELGQIRQAGLDLSNAIRGVTTVQTSQGARGNRDLFNGVTSIYTGTVGDLDSALQTVEDNYIHEQLISSLKHPSNVLDFWGAPDQPLAYVPDNTWCPDAGVEAPSTMAAWIPSLYLVRNYLTPESARSQGQAKIVTCWNADWTNVRRESQPKGVTAYFGTLQVTFFVIYDGVFVASRDYQSGEEQYGTCANPAEPDACYMKDPVEEAEDNWTSGRNYKQLLESSSQPSPVTPSEQQARDAKQAQVTNEVNQSLHSHQLAIYQAVLDALSHPTSQKAAARTLAAAGDVLTSLIELGMPRALTTDEYLRSFLEGSALESDQRLFGEGMISNWYTAAFLSLLKDQGQSLTADQLALVDWFRRQYGAQPLTINPRAMLKQAISARAALLRQQLEQYFELVDEGVYKDSQPLVEMTLLQLDLFDSVGRMARPTPTPTATATTPPTPQPEPSGTPAPDPSGTPAPDPSGTPAPDTSGTPAPDPSETPAPDPSSTPIPDPSATPVPTSDPADPADPENPAGAGWISPEAGGQVAGEVGMDITLDFPAGAYPEPFEVKLEVVSEPPATSGHTVLGEVFDIVAFDGKHQPVTHFDKPFTLVAHYADAASLAEDHFQLYAWRDGQWVAAPTVVDSGANTLTATLDHLSIFSAFKGGVQLFMPVVQR